MEVNKIINNKDIFIEIKKNINEIEKATFIENNAISVIMLSSLLLTIISVFIESNNFFLVILKITTAILPIIVNTFYLTGHLNKVLLKLKTKNESEINKLLIKSVYNLTNIDSVFSKKKTKKQFKELLKNPETINCLKKINKVQEIIKSKNKTYFEKNIYKEVLAYSIKENNISDIENTKIEILEEIKSFSDKDKRVIEKLLIERLGLDNLIKKQKKLEVILNI
jgi:hypothetical protein